MAQASCMFVFTRVLRGSVLDSPGGKTGPPCVTVSWPQAYLREKTMQREEMRCPCSTSGMHGTRRGTKQTKQHGKYTKIGR